MIFLTVEECQKSPCFFCKSMCTMLDIPKNTAGFSFKDAEVRAWCDNHSPEFPHKQCEAFHLDKILHD